MSNSIVLFLIYVFACLTHLNGPNPQLFLSLIDLSWQAMFVFFLICSFAVINIFMLKCKNADLISEKEYLKVKFENDRRILQQEINHRVRNNLQVVSSLLNLQSSQTTDPVAQKALKEGRDRVRFLARIHQHIYYNQGQIFVNTKLYIEDLVQKLFSNYQLGAAYNKMVFDIEPMKLDIDRAISLGLILNELFTVFLNQCNMQEANFSLKITLKKENKRLIMTILDSDICFPPDLIAKEKNSFELRLIRLFSDKLKADVYIDEVKSGTVVRLLFPIQNAS